MTGITIPCASQPDDVLTVGHLDGVRGAVVEMVTKQVIERGPDDEVVADETTFHLDPKTARDLFNWLGVWLHGGNRS